MRDTPSRGGLARSTPGRGVAARGTPASGQPACGMPAVVHQVVVRYPLHRGTPACVVPARDTPELGLSTWHASPWSIQTLHVYIIFLSVRHMNKL